MSLQLRLLQRLGRRASAPRTVFEGAEELTSALAGARVLLVVDDVWSDAAAHAFRVTGPHGRLLLTSRDQQVISAVGAQPHRLGVLSHEAARALAAAVLGRRARALPAAADEALAQVGRIPLAVALLAAAVRGGRRWEQVGTELTRGADVYGEHPYADTFRAMRIGTTALADELRTALLGLAVFPPDARIPVAAVVRYWRQTRGSSTAWVEADLDRLAAANLLNRDERSIGFHDLQHDYLLLLAPALPVLHAELLDAYRDLLPADARDQWWRLPPDEPYLWESLVGHLAGAGDRRTLAATVVDPAYLARRITLGGSHAGEADLAAAASARVELGGWGGEPFFATQRPRRWWSASSRLRSRCWASCSMSPTRRRTRGLCVGGRCHWPARIGRS